jgi:transcriptional regulator with XRE-family HTH domain
MVIPEKPSPDQVIARNVRRLRLLKGWTQSEFAERLGVSKTVVLDYEGRRKSRSHQRPFRWQDLIELCYLLDTTLYQLVLPNDPDEKVDLFARSTFDAPLGDWPLIADESGSIGPRSRELGLRLFGDAGDDLLEADELNRNVEEASEGRRAALLQIQETMAELGLQLEAMFPHGLEGEFTEDTASGSRKLTLRPRRPPNEAKE